MNEERVQVLAEYLSEDADRAQRLLGMDVNEAQQAINADGYDFSVEELQQFAEKLVAVGVANKEGELNAEDLDSVSGGILASTCVAIGLFAIGLNRVCWLGRQCL